MLQPSKLVLLATLFALASSGCDCSSDPDRRDGGGGTEDDGGGGGDDGGGNGGDGGGNGGDGGGNNDTDGGNTGTTCLTIDQACAGKCGFVGDGCSGGFDCSSTAGVANGGVMCTSAQVCSNSACSTPMGPGGEMPTVCPSPTTNAAARCAAVQQVGGQPTGTQTCGEWTDSNGCPVDCWPTTAHTCSVAGQTCSQAAGSGNTGPFACRAAPSGTVCSGDHCDNLPTGCATPTSTTFTGVVRTPGRDHDNNAGTVNINRVPVPNAIVYIPATDGAYPSVSVGIVPNDPASCGRCSQEVWTTGNVSVLASAVTDYQGRFTLTGQIPTDGFDLVIKTGKWRRVVHIPANRVTACAASNGTNVNTATDAESALPSVGSADGSNNIPHIAISTGRVDAMECVLRNVGLAEAQFTRPTVTTSRTAGRIHMYRANGANASGTCTGGNANCAATALYGTSGSPATNRLNEYDMVVMDCEGAENQYNAQEPNMIDYVDNGGRLFASHYAYTWIEDNGTLDASADWGASGAPDNGTGRISLPTGTTMRTRANAVKSLVFRDFLDFQGALTGTTAGLPLENPTTPQFPIAFPRDRAGANVGASTDEWVYRNNGDGNPRVQQLSFNTPYGASATTACGRVAYSGFHVANADFSTQNPPTFPTSNYCSNGNLSAQELVLAYMLFDLNSCVSTGVVEPPATCTPRTKTSVCGAVAGVTCGQFSDGCGGLITCDPCDTGEFCAANVCTPSTCDAQTCGDLGLECGQHSDRCGGIATGCAPCPSGEFCSNGQCVNNCVPLPDPCGNAGANCGTGVVDSCGTPVNCGVCPDGIVCENNICILE